MPPGLDAVTRGGGDARNDHRRNAQASRATGFDGSDQLGVDCTDLPSLMRSARYAGRVNCWQASYTDCLTAMPPFACAARLA